MQKGQQQTCKEHCTLILLVLTSGSWCSRLSHQSNPLKVSSSILDEPTPISLFACLTLAFCLPHIVTAF